MCQAARVVRLVLTTGCELLTPAVQRAVVSVLRVVYLHPLHCALQLVRQLLQTVG